MSSYPPQPGQPQAYHYQPPPTNALGVAGFVVSLTGMVACLGLICPIGLLLSLIALTMSPRGYAIAGSIIGLLGSILGVLTVLVVAGVIGNGLFWNAYYDPTVMAIDSASYDIDAHFSNNNSTLPNEPTGNTLISGYTDEWGNALKYEPIAGSTTDYTITSSGEDGLFGTNDDVPQHYTAYNYNTWGGSSQHASPTPNEAIEHEEIEAAFNLAAKQIAEAFPTGSAMPTTAQVTQKVGTFFDSWLTPMTYSTTDSTTLYHLESAGPDRQWGTSDDLTRSFYFAPTGKTDGPL